MVLNLVGCAHWLLKHTAPDSSSRVAGMLEMPALTAAGAQQRGRNQQRTVLDQFHVKFLVQRPQQRRDL